MMKKFDYGIIGGGPAGYTSAMSLAQQGFKVILFEKNNIGGTCLNKGCIPTKSFLRSVEIYENLKKAQEFGIEINTDNFNFSKVIEKKNDAVEKIRKSLELSIKNLGITVIKEEAFVENEKIIKIKNDSFEVDNIIIATGSKPKEIKGLEYDGQFILNSDDVLELKILPKSVLIIGSGAIGLEWARIFHGFDCEVQLVELQEHLCPLADIEVSKRIERIFKQKKIKFYLKDCISSIQNKKVILQSGIEITPDIILVAVGREALPIPKVENIKILGDAYGKIQLAHYAISQAKQCSLDISFDETLVPSVIYGEPEIAWVGLREQDIDESFSKITLPITALGKSWCDCSTDGFIKIILKDDYIYGAHIVSKEASSLIHILLVAIQNKIKIQDLKSICFAHPTYAEGICEILGRI